MKQFLIIASAAIAAAIFVGCSGLSREEVDYYQIAERDTTTFWQYQNAPDSSDGERGTIYPSNRLLQTKRYLVLKDSNVRRTYPDFIRASAFEAVGVIGGAEGGHAIGTGLFGIFPDYGDLTNTYRGKDDALFTGGIYRIGSGEWRLRWFRDAPDWTIGTSSLEVLAKDAKLETMLASVFPLYIRKRFYFIEDRPYLCATPYFGVGYYPSQYVNLGGSVEFGSIGGLNMRLYAGFATGLNLEGSPLIRWSEYETGSRNVVFPYAGLGISFLDFHNLVEETYIEWKDQDHYSWNIGFVQIATIASGAERSIFQSDEETGQSVISGFLMRVFPTSIAIPLKAFNNKLYVGTSGATIVALGENEWGFGVLPLRVGYWQTVIADELSVEPFAELSYYPSTMVNAGARLNLRVSPSINLGLYGGFAAGENPVDFGADVESFFGESGDFSRPYLGVGIGIADRIFFPQELIYFKKAKDKK